MGNCVSGGNSTIDRVHLDISTWQKESHGLYDYESKQLEKLNMQVDNNGYLIRVNNSISWVQQVDNQQIVLELQKDGSQFFVRGNQNHIKQDQNNHLEISEQPAPQIQGKMSTFKLSVSQNTMMKSEQRPQKDDPGLQLHQMGYEKGNKPWVVVQSLQKLLPDSSVQIEKGDILKLGRIKMRVREINLQNDDFCDLKSMRSDHSSNNSFQLCRICLSEKYSATNPLLNPCKCAGTMKYIHLECLQTWLRQKLHSKQNDNCTIYLWKDLSCELCKFQYKPIFESDGVRYDLVELSKPRGVPYVLLELHSKKLQPHQVMEQGDPFTQKACGIYIITFTNKKQCVGLGRAHENEVRVSDISVSRFHAQISMKNHKIYLKDLQSKFGTLLLIKNDLNFNRELNGLQVQVGRTLITLKSDTKVTCFSD